MAALQPAQSLARAGEAALRYGPGGAGDQLNGKRPWLSLAARHRKAASLQGRSPFRVSLSKGGSCTCIKSMRLYHNSFDRHEKRPFGNDLVAVVGLSTI
jgi:hypothetical protein